MHTADGFITSWVCVLTLLITMGFVGYSFYNLRKSITKQKIIQMSAIAAVIFALQMLNFPIAKGTSGHFIGAGLAALLLGPSATIVIMTFVLSIQAIVYGDGGMLVLGANILNMGIITAYATHFVHKALKKNVFSGAFASFLGVVAASVAVSLELWISGTVSLFSVLPAMVMTHMIIGIGEGVITSGILVYAQKWKVKDIKYVVSSIGAAVLLLAILSPFASPHPDGLEWVAMNVGFFENAVTAYPYAIMPDYVLGGSVLLAGLVGMMITFSATYSAMRFLKPAKG